MAENKLSTKQLDLLWATNLIEMLKYTSHTLDADETFKLFAEKVVEYTNADQVIFHRFGKRNVSNRVHVYNKNANNHSEETFSLKGDIHNKGNIIGELTIKYLDSKLINNVDELFELIRKTLELIVARLYERAELQESQVKTIVSALASDYGNITYVDLVNGTDRIIKANSSGILVEDDKDKVGYADRVAHYVSNFVVPEEREETAYALSIPAGIEHTKDGKPYSVSCRIMLDGKVHYRNVKFVPEVENGKVVALVIGYQSTDSEHMYQEQLEEALTKAETANKAKTTFLFNMSHDIRTPMNAISGFTDLAIKNIDEKDKALDYLNKIQNSNKMLLSLINSVLEVSRIESGKVKLEENPGDVYYSFSNIIDPLTALAKEKNISLKFEFGHITNRFVYCDFSRSLRIFVNVISNAIKYTPNGGKVHVLCEQVGSQNNGIGTYRYTISDNGIGMSEEFQKHLFEQFAREESSTVSGIQGTGLGLSVCKSLVELMGGAIQCSSKQGVGTTFTIVLPLKLQKSEIYTDPKTGKIVGVTSKDKSIDLSKFKGKRILVVEDNVLNKEIIVEILEENGFVVDSVSNGKEALDQLFKTGTEFYSCVLMDIQMPVMNGLEATKEIRRIFKGKKLPIIALSANAFEEDKMASIAVGMDGHIAKPIDIEEFLDVLDCHIE